MTEHGTLSATRIAEIQREIDAYRGYFVSTLLRELLQHATDLEAVGRAAVRALADIYACPQAEACPRCWMDLSAVLATDTAKAWLTDGQE